MTYISLYRKWRPQSFDEVVGQDHVSKTLANAVKDDRVAHAYLFAGPRGTGKTSTAKILAKSINCKDGPTPRPCGKCDSCLAITAGSSLDVIEMDAASNRGIEEIRELRDKVAFAATTARRKVYIIDEVHMLTEPAFNALLKTIEEPPGHVVFVLATTDPHKVPATIASRCQQFEFRRIPLPALIDHLAKVAKEEKIKISKEALAAVGRHAEGSLRDAIGMLDQLSAYKDKKISEDEVASFLGIPSSSLVEGAIDLILSGDVSKVFDFVESLVEAGRDLRQFIAALLGYTRDLFILINISGADPRRRLIHRSEEVIERMIKQADALGANKTRSLLTELSRLFDELRFAPDPRLALELSLVRLMRGDEISIEALADRVADLEENGPSLKQSSAPAQRATAASPAGKPPVKKRNPGSGGLNIGTEEVESSWSSVLAAARKKKLSLGAFLIECRPREIKNGRLRLIFPATAQFARGELEKEPNAGLFRQALEECFGSGLSFETEASTEPAAAKEDAAPAARKAQAPKKAEPAPASPAQADKTTAASGTKNKTETAAIEAENDMLDLLKESFGAEIVE